MIVAYDTTNPSTGPCIRRAPESKGIQRPKFWFAGGPSQVFVGRSFYGIAVRTDFVCGCAPNSPLRLTK